MAYSDGPPEPSRKSKLAKIVRVPPPSDLLPTVPHDLGHTLLMQYSEWLDVNNISPGQLLPNDKSTHSDLVDEFLAQRNPRAIPQLEK
jgi:hypothetical protein